MRHSQNTFINMFNINTKNDISFSIMLNWKDFKNLLVTEQGSFKLFVSIKIDPFGEGILYLVPRSVNVIRQSGCLIINPIAGYSYDFLFNCTPLGQPLAI